MRKYRVECLVCSHNSGSSFDTIYSDLVSDEIEADSPLEVLKLVKDYICSDNYENGYRTEKDGDSIKVYKVSPLGNCKNKICELVSFVGAYTDFRVYEIDDNGEKIPVDV